MKRLAIAALIVFVTSFGIVSSPVKALDGTWCYVFLDGFGPIANSTETIVAYNFGDPAITISSAGTYNATRDDYLGVFGTPNHSVIAVTITLPAGSEFSAIGMNYQRAYGNNGSLSPRPAEIRNLSTNLNLAYQSNRSASLQTLETTGALTGVTSIRVAAMGYGPTHSAAPGVWITRLAMSGTGDDPFDDAGGSGNNCPEEEELIRPLSDLDQHPWGQFEQGGGYSQVAAISNEPGMPVYAGADGTVTYVGPLQRQSCETFSPQATLTEIAQNAVPLDIPIPGFIQVGIDVLDATIARCVVGIPAAVTGEIGTSYYTLGNGNGLEDPFDNTISGVWTVVIKLDDGRVLNYQLDDADQYLEVGQRVNAGCIIGKTAKMRGFGVVTGYEDLLYRPLSEHGITRVVLLGQPIGSVDNPFPPYGVIDVRVPEETLDLLTILPNPSAACNAEPEFLSCIGDGALSDEDSWQTRGSVIWNDPGVTLGGTASIFTQMNLDGAQTIQVAVSAAVLAGDGEIEVRIGSLANTFDITSEDPAEYTAALAPPSTPDAGLFYTISVYNTRSTLVDLDYICVTMYGETPPPVVPIPPKPFKENCDPLTQPVSETLVAQVGWLWQRLNGFFQCDLMRMLNRMYKLSLDTYELVGWSVRYSISVVLMWSRWIGTDLIPWANGHFANIANGRQTFIQVNSTQTCNNLFCVVESLFGGIENIFDDLANTITTAISQVLAPITNALIGILNLTVGFIFNLLTAIISIALRLLGLVLSAFSVMFGFFGVITSAWNNSAPINITGLPYCATNPQENGFCIFLWMAEHTIFSGPGAAIIPLLVAYFSALLIIWGIKEIKSMILQTGNAL